MRVQLNDSLVATKHAAQATRSRLEWAVLILLLREAIPAGDQRVLDLSLWSSFLAIFNILDNLSWHISLSLNQTDYLDDLILLIGRRMGHNTNQISEVAEAYHEFDMKYFSPFVMFLTTVVRTKSGYFSASDSSILNRIYLYYKLGLS
jgi:hypothetical protein